MSHEVEVFEDGSAAFVSALEDAWHRLGTVLPGKFTADEALQIAKLGGWNVEKLPVYTRLLTSDGFTEVPLPDKFVTARRNPVTGDQEVVGVKSGHHGIVGAIYDPFQNESLCAFLDALVDEGGAHLETAGSLRDGADIFVAAKLPNTILVGGVDPVDSYITALNNHTGAAAIRGIVGKVRVVCANTQRMAEKAAKSRFSIRHTATAGQRVEEARKALDLSFKLDAVFEAEADRMINQALTDAQFDEIVKQLWTPPEVDSGRAFTLDLTRSNELHRLFADAETNANIRGTAWAGYQSVTEYLDHCVPVRSRGVDKAVARAERAATGEYDDLKAKAFALFSPSK